ncbi:DUF1839 family protein [Acidisoma silvae]|uniref:DUF1839 family protein n=1 Tax=Acidisoma silvae TaxID=2802396 RepID=UPI001D09EEB3|nr:DUF1839 family protein [Acidisoma silvae]
MAELSLHTEPRQTARFTPHALHGGGQSWPETNCYTDLWIEVLAKLGEIPEAAFGFGIAQAYEGDQFTFCKIPSEDLRRLYGLTVQEISIYHTLDQHIAQHVGRGRVVLLEVDAFYLPDTLTTTYRRQHVKTTIAVDYIDLATKRSEYFHNAARSVLQDEDYYGAFRLRPEFSEQPDLLSPYVEIVKRGAAPLDPAALHATAVDLLRRHLSDRPTISPFSAWRDAFPNDLARLSARPETFHDYAFHFPRAIGANFELFGSHAAWLAPDQLLSVQKACARIAHTTKILQFRLARSIARNYPDLCLECFDTLEAAYAEIVQDLRWFTS